MQEISSRINHALFIDLDGTRPKPEQIADYYRFKTALNRFGLSLEICIVNTGRFWNTMNESDRETFKSNILICENGANIRFGTGEEIKNYNFSLEEKQNLIDFLRANKQVIKSATIGDRKDGLIFYSDLVEVLQKAKGKYNYVTQSFEDFITQTNLSNFGRLFVKRSAEDVFEIKSETFNIQSSPNAKNISFGPMGINKLTGIYDVLNYLEMRGVIIDSYIYAGNDDNDLVIFEKTDDPKLKSKIQVGKYDKLQPYATTTIPEPKQLYQEIEKIRMAKNKQQFPSLHSSNTPIGRENPSLNNLLLSQLRAGDAEQAHLHLGTRLSGRPHLGTILTHLIAATTSSSLDCYLPTNLTVTLLDNVFADEKIDAGDLGQFVKYKPKADLPIEAYTDFYTSIQGYCSSPIRIALYSETQRLPQFREAVKKLLKYKEVIDNDLAFNDGIKLHIPCPCCSLIPKSGQNTFFTEAENGKWSVTGMCPNNGEFKIDLDDLKKLPIIGADALTRNLLNELATSESQQSGTIRVKAGDWTNLVFGLDNTLSKLGSVINPIRISTPLVVDSSGDKMSKSSKVQDKIQEVEQIVLTKLDKTSVDKLWQLAEVITSDLKHFNRNYSAQALLDIIDQL